MVKLALQSTAQRTLRQMFLSSASGQVGGEHGQAGASQHSGGEHVEAGGPHDDGGERVESGAAEHCDGIEVYEHPATTSIELFVSDREEDRVLLDWLRERPEHPRCSVLLRQIMEWTGKATKQRCVHWPRRKALPSGGKTELMPKNSEKLCGDTSKRRWGRKKDASHASNSVLLKVLQNTRIRWHSKQSTS